MLFADRWNDTEKLMLFAVGSISGHARRMMADADNRRASERRALNATAEKIRTLRETVSTLLSHPLKAAQALAVGLNELTATVPAGRYDGRFVGLIAECAFDGGMGSALPAPIADGPVEDDDDVVLDDTDKLPDRDE